MTRILLARSCCSPASPAAATYEKLYQPAEFRPVTDVPKGPGLFTGESGVYTLCCGDGAPLGSDGPAGAGNNAYAGDDYEVVSNKPGEPVIVKRRRGDRE